MTTRPIQLRGGRYRAPKEDGGVLVEPPFAQMGGLLAENRSRRSTQCYDLQGRCLSDVARDARRELVMEARRWTSQYRDVDCGSWSPSTPILLAGHQPQLFHPGVWLKNFALGALARQNGALAVNLVIDSDTAKTTSVRVPGGSAAHPWIEDVPFDRSGPVIPYEERPVLDRELFFDFGRRAAECIASLVPDPLLRRYWSRATARMAHTDNLGACLAQSRHELEGDWGVATLEVPQSRVCRMEPHAWFVAHLVAQLPRFQAVYNGAVEEYRRVNRIRSTAHPVPNLVQEGQWWEAPFWIWTADDPQRRRLFVRRARGEIELSDRGSRRIGLSLSPDGDAGRAAEQLVALGRQGVKIRCRALVTTLWARLVLGDVFVHGIGGAKYDQVTDALIRNFFGLDPPGLVVLSGTLHLPVERARVSEDARRRIKHRLRELTFHPECCMNRPSETRGERGSEAEELIRAKRRWIETRQTPQNAGMRYREIRRINAALQPWVASQRERLRDEQEAVDRALRAEAVLSWREYAFCLFPEKTLQDFFDRVLHKSE